MPYLGRSAMTSKSAPQGPAPPGAPLHVFRISVQHEQRRPLPTPPDEDKAKVGINKLGGEIGKRSAHDFVDQYVD
jgi:hypothetical protein